MNVYALNLGEPKYIKQLMTNVSNLIGKNVVIAGILILYLQQWTDHLGRKSIKKLP